VAVALRSRALADGVREIMAGAARLDNPVRWVHSVESPEMAALLRGGALLLMTGTGIPAAESAQRRFVASLAERQVVRVVIELGTALATVPRALVSEGKRTRRR
jgi:purine catabolism regulator